MIDNPHSERQKTEIAMKQPTWKVRGMSAPRISQAIEGRALLAIRTSSDQINW